MSDQNLRMQRFMDSATRLPVLVASVLLPVEGEHTEPEVDHSMTSRLLGLAVLFATIGGFEAEFDRRSMDGAHTRASFDHSNPVSITR